MNFQFVHFDQFVHFLFVLLLILICQDRLMLILHRMMFRLNYLLVNHFSLIEVDFQFLEKFSKVIEATHLYYPHFQILKDLHFPKFIYL